MKRNQKKTVIATYTPRINPSYNAYKIDGVAVERNYLASDLMDSKLLFPQHDEPVVFKPLINLGLFKLFWIHFKSTESCMSLYKSLVRTLLEYASVV